MARRRVCEATQERPPEQDKDEGAGPDGLGQCATSAAGRQQRPLAIAGSALGQWSGIGSLGLRDLGSFRSTERGCNVVGEALSVSYKPVTRWLPGWYRELPGTSPARLLATKVVADSLLFQAPFLTLYFMVMGALEGLSPQKIFAKTKESFHQAWALSLLVWTPVQFLNFYFLPVHFQAAFVSAVNVGWKVST